MAAGFREGFVAAERFASATANSRTAGYVSSWMRGVGRERATPVGVMRDEIITEERVLGTGGFVSNVRATLL
jgi:hypothetical protein